jgi:dUTP pyrophosphatase
MRIKIKRLHPNAVLPKYAKQGDAGMDLTAVSCEEVNFDHIKYNFGLAFEIP